ncbi:hypothetical protein N9896_03150 [bacterium]|nr:hypothetical protein [bacterium]
MNAINKFWEKDQDEKIKIKHNDTLEFLEEKGYANIIMSENQFRLVQKKGNIVSTVTPAIVRQAVRGELIKLGNKPVLEAFTRGISTYLSPNKLELLRPIPIIASMDDADTTWFYYQNLAIKVTKSTINKIEYTALGHVIWENNIISRKYIPADDKKSQFEQFCLNISGQDQDRFKALQTAIGYLLSRFKNPGNPRAVILIEQQMSSSSKANGGTGKSLLAKGIECMRNVVNIDGKYYKPADPFSNQMIDSYTDVLNYDDMGKNFNLESVFSMVTSGVTVNKKHQQAYYLKPENAPKMLISSNYVVNGPGGNADKRRRCEFELAPHYGPKNQPEDEFGNLFFQGWDADEWNRFDAFMTSCAQEYLINGLLIAKPINLEKNKLIASTSAEFIDFMDKQIVLNKKLDKRTFIADFNKESGSNISSNAFTRLLKTYADKKGLLYEDRSSGGNFYFWMKDIKPKKEKSLNEKEGDNIQSPE